MYLINAVYFKGDWSSPFDEGRTTDDTFRLADGSAWPCRMMQRRERFRYHQADDFQAVDLPYGDDNFSMTVLLPAEAVPLDSLSHRLSATTWSEWTQRLSYQEVRLMLPKFTVSYDVSLNSVLKSMGMAVAFSDYADFSAISPDTALTITEVKHKTFVAVDEKGTEAAAVTSVAVGLANSVEPEPVVMRVDRPFLFAIRERHSGSIVFLGKVGKPLID
jgi:serpin B